MESKLLISYDPSNGQVLGQVEKTSIEEIHKTVARARKAQKQWAAFSIDQRIDYLEKASDVLRLGLADTAKLLSQEMGKGYGRAMSEVQSCCDDVSYKTKEIKEALKTQTIEAYGSRTELQYNPLGVCAIIAPWNYPVSMGHWLILPALTAGNTVVYKPSEETPLVAQAYVDALNQVLPENVLQIIHGDKDQGEALVNSDVNLIAFTGSRETGKKIMEGAASGLKRLIMEMGGNDPLIVLEDADLERAARFAIASSFENSGQMCISAERILVDDKIADRFEELAVTFAHRYEVGPWNDPEADLGPIINEKQRKKILKHIEDAIEKGAKVLYGGDNHPDRYILPTVLSNISQDMLVWQEESFGPLACISRFKDIEEAISLANDSSLGLGASVFGHKDADYVASQIEAGMVGINQGSGAGLGDMPWVGAKESSLGYHGSPDGHRQFTQAKVVSSR